MAPAGMNDVRSLARLGCLLSPDSHRCAFARVGGCAVQCVAMTLRAAAHSGAWSPALTTKLTDRFLALCNTTPTPSTTPATAPTRPPDGLATVVWALATLPQSDENIAATGKLRRLVETHLEQFDVKELARLVWALAVLDQLDMDLLQAMTARVQVRGSLQRLIRR